MERRLTAKQQAFLKAHIDTGMKNAAAAYRTAYPASLKWKPNIVASEAAKMLAHPRISPVIAEARRVADLSLKDSVERYAISKDWLVDKLVGAFQRAEEANNYPAVGRLGELLSRLHGYIEDKSRVRVVRTVEDLSDEELAALAQTERESDTTRH